MSDSGGAAIEDFYLEERLFPPPEGFTAQAVVSDGSLAERAASDVEAFWAEQAGALDWYDRWHTVLEWDLPFARWFVGGTLNVSHNCLDRHVAAGLGGRGARSTGRASPATPGPSPTRSSWPRSSASPTS